MTNVRGSMEAVTFGDGVVKCLIIWRWGPLSMVVCFVFMGDSVQIYKVLIRCVCFFFWFWHLSATFQIPTDPLAGHYCVFKIRAIDRKQEVPHDGPMCDLLWSDPDGKSLSLSKLFTHFANSFRSVLLFICFIISY